MRPCRGEQLFARADASAARACTQPECDLVGTERLFAPQRPNGFNGHPPLGVNATVDDLGDPFSKVDVVSMGTHPWG